MTTLEKAAKAMFEQVQVRAKSAGLIFGPETQWEELPDWAQKEYTDQVRAALESLRMPTRHMVAEANKRNGGAEHAADCWIRMVDAILNEKA